MLKVQVSMVYLLVSVVILGGCAYFYFHPILFNPIPNYFTEARMAGLPNIKAQSPLGACVQNPLLTVV